MNPSLDPLPEFKSIAGQVPTDGADMFGRPAPQHNGFARLGREKHV